MDFLKLNRIAVIIICLILTINLAVFIASQIIPPSLRGKATEGNPYLFVNVSEYWSAITDYAVCSNYLYVLYGSKNILVCYNLDGEYSHSYALSMSKNGQAHLYADNNVLYLESSEHSFYCFTDGKFTDFIKPSFSELAHIRDSLQRSDLLGRTEDGVQYERRGASIWKQDTDGSKEILHRDGWLVLFQGYTQIMVHIVCILLLFLIKYIS